MTRRSSAVTVALVASAAPAAVAAQQTPVFRTGTRVVPLYVTVTDAQGWRVSFRNTIVIGTSNLGSSQRAEKRAIGFGGGQGQMSYDEARTLVLGEVRKHFRPEFLNRIDDMIVFHALDATHIRAIVDRQLAELAARLEELGVGLEVSDGVKDPLAKEWFHPTYGARPPRREIERRIENPLSMRVVRGEFKAGDRVEQGYDAGGVR